MKSGCDNKRLPEDNKEEEDKQINRPWQDAYNL